VEIKNNCEFNTYNKDIEKIKSDINFTKRLLDWLNIYYTEEDNHNILIQKLEKYTDKITESEIEEKCINKEELFTMEDLKNIAKIKLVMLNEINGKYYCFDVIALRNFIFQKQNDKFKNPYTNTDFSQADIDKILNVDITKIKYFC
jgi:hypothetical protein